MKYLRYFTECKTSWVERHVHINTRLNGCQQQRWKCFFQGDKMEWLEHWRSRDLILSLISYFILEIAFFILFTGPFPDQVIFRTFNFKYLHCLSVRKGILFRCSLFIKDRLSIALKGYM